jgi:ribosome-associated protein
MSTATTLWISERLELPLGELQIEPLRAQGAGGQHVNRTESAVQLRFDIAASSLPEDCKARLLQSADRRRSNAGELVIRAQEHRSQRQNREAALQRLAELIRAAATPPRLRKATRPSKAAKARRLDSKALQGRRKALRRPVSE